MVPSDIMEHCRLCLVKESVSINIFENENEIRQLYFKIIACLPIRLSRQDQRLPKKICASCNLKVDELYQFWTQTANTEKTLERWISEADQAQAVTLTKIKCEFDADMPITKIEPRDHSSDDGDRGMDGFDDNYRDDSDVPDTDFEPNSMMHVTYEDVEPSGDIDRKPKKIIKKKSESKNKKRTSSVKKKEKKPQAQTLKSAAELKQEKQECPHCATKFVPSKLERHIKAKHTFPCKPCNVVFHLRKDLNEHRLLSENCSHVDDDENRDKFCCSLCNYTVYVKKNLELHIKRKHMIEVNILCPECGQGFFNVKELESHKIEVHGADPFVCAPCNKTFSKLYNLRLHQRRYHENVNKECKICHKVLRTARLSEHMKQVHYAKVFQCHLCNKAVVTEKNYKKHLTLHSDEKPFECPFCRKAFKLKYYLTLHLRTHTGVRPMFECETCHKVLPTDCRTKHMASHNVSKTFLCSVCGAGFVNDCGLKVHMRRHQ